MAIATIKKEIISKKTRREFREAFSWFYKLKEIRDEFEAYDLQYDENHRPNIDGARRTLVEQYYATIDLTNHIDVSKLLKVYEAVLFHIKQVMDRCPPDGFYPHQCLEKLIRCLEEDGYTVTNFKISSPIDSTLLEQTTLLSEKLNSDYLNQQIKRIQDSVDNDPTLAIGSAKELVETICKSILIKMERSDFENLDFPKLVWETAGELRLLPNHISDDAKGAESIKRLLGNLANISSSLAELRNIYGTGHGKTLNSKGLSPRHARLAAGSAITLAHFLYDTYIEKYD